MFILGLCVAKKENNSLICAVIVDVHKNGYQRTCKDFCKKSGGVCVGARNDNCNF